MHVRRGDATAGPAPQTRPRGVQQAWQPLGTPAPTRRGSRALLRPETRQSDLEEDIKFTGTGVPLLEPSATRIPCHL